MDDTTPSTQSIRGKVVSLVDQAAPYINSGPQSTSMIWGSNGNGSTCTSFPSNCNVSYDIIPGIDDTSTSGAGSPAYSGGAPTTYTFVNMYTSGATRYTYSSSNPFSLNPFEACDGAADGACNQRNILDYYNAVKTQYNANAPSPYTQTLGTTNLTYYPAGVCYNYTAGSASTGDWYFPAICEMDAVAGTCPSVTQSMVASLGFLLGNPNAATPSTSCSPPSGTNCLAGNYWSSTEFSGNPQNFAWIEYFASSGSNQNLFNKSNQLGVRCSRAF